MNKRFVICVLAALAGCLLSSPAVAQEAPAGFGADDGWGDDSGWADDSDWDDWSTDAAGDGWGTDHALSISGYFNSGLSLLLASDPFADWGNPGAYSHLRLRANAALASGLGVVLEADVLDLRGYLNPAVRLGVLAKSGSIEAGDPQEWHLQPAIDYLYANARFGIFDLRLGSQPLVWGTAYAFNPVDLANSPSLAGFSGQEPPGLAALSLALTPGTSWGLEAWAALAPRNRNGALDVEVTGFADLPFGARVRWYPGMWDFAAGLVRSLDFVADPELGTVAANGYHLTVEAAGSLGGLGVYGEAALEFEDFESVLAAAGLMFSPTDELSLQLEYHFRGDGAGSSSGYSLQRRLGGELLARHYGLLVAVYDHQKLMARSSLAVLVNLVDRSLLLGPEFKLPLVDNLELELSALLQIGERDSEFGGVVDIPDTASLDFGRSRINAALSWYF